MILIIIKTRMLSYGCDILYMSRILSYWYLFKIKENDWSYFCLFGIRNRIFPTGLLVLPHANVLCKTKSLGFPFKLDEVKFGILLPYTIHIKKFVSLLLG